jgi:hypothetical protein
VKKLLLFMLLAVSGLYGQTTATVTGHLKSGSSSSIGTTNNAYVRFQLVNCGANVPRVIGTGVIVAQTVDFRPNSSGVISGTVYANSAINCGGVTNTQWRISHYFNGSQVGPSRDFIVGSGTFNLDSATPTVLIPTLPASPLNAILNPTTTQNIVQPSGTKLQVSGDFEVSGDFTFAAGSLDGSTIGSATLNNPTFTGTAIGPLSINKINGVFYADQFAGADAGAKIQAAIDALPSGGGIVDATNFTGDQAATTTITIAKPVTLLIGLWRLISSASTAAVAVTGDGVRILGTRNNNGTGTSGIVVTSAGSDTVVWKGSYGAMRDLHLVRGGTNSGAALSLPALGTGGIKSNDFRNLNIVGGGLAVGSIGIELIADSNTELVSHNTFDHIYLQGSEKEILLTTSGTQGPTDNYFYGINVSFGSVTGNGISIESGDLNQFFGSYIADKNFGIAVFAGASYNSFFGMRLESNTTNLSDNGTGSMFIGHSQEVAAISGTDNTRILTGTGNANAGQWLGMGPFQMGGESNPIATNVLTVRTLTKLQGTGTQQAGVQIAPVTGSDATSQGIGLLVRADTPDVSFTQALNTAIHVQDATKGAASTITEANGLRIADITTGTTNYAIRTLGNASSWFNGGVKIGTGITIASSNNIVQYVGTITTTATASDDLTYSGLTTASHCFWTATNATAEAMTGLSLATSTNTATLSHSATAGGTFAIFCSIN